MRTISVAILAAVLALAAPFAVEAAGLGRLTVLSSLGAPLNAEIELVSLQPGEEDGLTARIASLDAFREAGIEPSGALSGVRFAIVRRDGKPIIRVTSSQPVNEPFVDLLIELEWTGGRLVREYTFLLDPPEYRRGQAIVAAPTAAPTAVPETAAGPIAHPLPALETKPQASTPAPAPIPQPSVPKAVAATSYEVRRGDTLGEIARANLPSGVSLNQMLTAIYRANQDAFLRENINLVRAGRILQLPTAESASGIDVDEANRLVQSHRAEWDDYRSRVAAQPVRVETASGQRAVSGRIEAKPEPTTPAATQDEVRLAKADPAKQGAGARAARADDAAARERALKEAQSRVSDLEKNVADLQKLLELKNQQLAELEKKAAKPAAPAPAAAQPEPKTAPAPVVAEAPKPAPEVKKVEPAKPKAKAAPPPPPPAPSLLDEFLENPIALAGLGSVVVLLLGYGLWSWRRKKATQAKFSDSVIGATSGAASSFNEAGAAAAGASGSQASLSQSSGMEAEEVDPIAEADVYMAYGRDAQAEEILKEALQKDPNRIPVHAKLLEIYAKRSDPQAFEQTALKLKNLTNGSGPDWEKALALGRSIDPGNGLYGGMSGGAGSAAGAGLAAAAAAAAPTIDFDIGGATSPGMVTTDIPLDDPEPKPVNLASIDFDLGTGTNPPEERAASDFSSGGTLKLDKPDVDATVANLDFDLNAGAPEKKLGESSGIDFDLNLDLGDKGGEAEKSVPPMDLSSISLDLGSPGEPGAPSSNDPKWQEVATKLDLAKAYEEMGDKDGARELLSEVMKDGDAAQKGQAQQLLTKLG